ncbi:MAG: hypothetical protein E7166_04095 [Firmicutes bacterium]|nr:hypothetical protein [Bacillota bacterium]
MGEKYYKEIKKLCEKAMKIDCVPVGAVVVLNNKIIGRGYNKKEKTKNPLDHAEIIAIKKATRKIKSWNLSECELIVSMIPCQMCKNVIYESRIKKIYYYIKNDNEKNKFEKAENSTSFQIINEQMYELEFISMLKKFFSEKRKKCVR